MKNKEEYTIRLSCYMVQVFYSKVTDLIKPDHMNKRKLIVKMVEGIVTVENATKLYFNLDEIKELIAAYEDGIHRRTMRETFVNETSSRSHLIFSVIIEMTRKGEQVP